MDQILEEHIQCMDERESMNSQESRKNSSTKKPERRKSFFSKIFKTEDKAQEKVPQFIASSQYVRVRITQVSGRCWVYPKSASYEGDAGKQA